MVEIRSFTKKVWKSIQLLSLSLFNVIICSSLFVQPSSFYVLILCAVLHNIIIQPKNQFKLFSPILHH